MLHAKGVLEQSVQPMVCTSFDLVSKALTKIEVNDAVEDYNNTPDKRHQFYYIKADDSILHKYVPYKYSSKQQIIQKFKYKLPKGIDETIDIKKIRDAEKTAEEDDIAVTDQETYEKKQEQEIKKRPDTSIRNIQQERQEEKKRKYYVFFSFSKRRNKK